MGSIHLCIAEGKGSKAALSAAHAASSELESALAKKKLLKKQKKAAAAAAAMQAEPRLVQQQSNKPEAAGVPQKQAMQAVPQAATAQKQSDSELRQHKKKQKLSAKAGAAQGTAVPLAAASLEATPMQSDAMTAAASDQDGAEAQQPAAKKRRVRFAMKRNLLMQIGGAVPPQEVRTPPGSRPKVAHLCLPLHCTALPCTALHCTALCCIALHALHCTATMQFDACQCPTAIDR